MKMARREVRAMPGESSAVDKPFVPMQPGDTALCECGHGIEKHERLPSYYHLPNPGICWAMEMVDKVGGRMCTCPEFRPAGVQGQQKG